MKAPSRFESTLFVGCGPEARVAHRWLCRGVLGLSLLGTCLATESSWGYAFYETRTVPPHPWRWWQRVEPLVFHVAQHAPQEIPLDEVPTLMKAAFDRWTDTTCQTVPEVVFGGFVNVTETTVPTDRDGPTDNVILFVTDVAQWQRLGHSTSELTVTKVYANDATGEIIDADIEVNDAHYTFATTDADNGPNEVDLVSAATEAAGHFFGMDRSTDPTATMYPAIAMGSPEDPHPQRTLAQDDIDGICALYGDVPAHVAPVEAGPESSGYGDGNIGDGDDTSATPEDSATAEVSGSSAGGGCDAGSGGSVLLTVGVLALGRRNRSRRA